MLIKKVDSVDSQDNINDRSETIEKKTLLETVLRLEQKIDSLKESTAHEDKTEIKSFKDVKQKLKAFASPGDHSKVLGAGSCFKNLFMLLLYIPLQVSC